MDRLAYLRSIQRQSGTSWGPARGASTARPARTPKAQRPRCGARTRQGTPCQRLPVWDEVHDRPRNGRCRNHGGLSTGARTPEGRARILAAIRNRASRTTSSP